MDRTIDINSRENGSRKSTTFYRNGTVHPIGSDTVSVPSTVLIRKRVPTGGWFNALSQKPFTHYTLKVNQPRGSMRQEYDGRTYTLYTGSIYGTYDFGWGDPIVVDATRFPPYRAEVINNVTPGLNPDLLSQAETKCLNKLRARSGEADLDYGLWWGERHETARLFRDAAFGVLNLARSIAQKDYRRSAEVLRDTFGARASAKAEAQRAARVDKWIKNETKKTGRRVNRTLRQTEDAALTYNLGVAPLLNDMQEAHQRLLTGDLTVKTAIKAVARHSRQRNDVHRNKTGIAQQTTLLNEVHGYTVTLVAVPKQDSLARLSRVGLTNPANTAWQLTGKSFLVDYVLPVGRFLEAIDIPLAFEFRQGSWTHFVSRVISTEVYTGGLVAKGESVLTYTKRSLYSQFPVPIPPLSLRNTDLSFRQLVNSGLLALKGARKLMGI